MKKHLLFVCAAAAVLTVSAFAGCSNDTPVSSQAPSSDVQSVVSSQAVSNTPSSLEESFSKNPIDLAYQEASSNAMSTMDMLEVEGQYTEVWKKEVESAYQKLLDAAPADQQAAIEKEQNTWSMDLPSQISQITDSDQNNAGTMASVNTAVAVRKLYRDRARELYESLYQYNPNFTYLYTPSASN